MKILITAGGTSERIDDVRRITNTGTGRLGAKIAERFAIADPANSITYICSGNAVRPRIDALSEIVCDEVGSVKEAVERVCANTKIDVIIHSMAISDYKISAVSESGLITKSVIERLSLLACGDSASPEEAVRDVLLSPPGVKEKKISSDKEDLIVVMKKAPKIIALLRGLAPGAVIVGFKLLSGAGEEELSRAGHALLVKNDCDLVFANDIQTIKADQHDGILISRDGSYIHASGRDWISELIVENACKVFFEKVWR